MKSFKETLAREKAQGTEKSAVPEETVAWAKKLATAYNGSSNTELLRRILAEAEKRKRAGTLSNAEIDAFFQAFSPMLEDGQRKRLAQVVERLKKL